MTCGTCTHWRLQGTLAPMGYGQCQARPEQLRTSLTTSAQNVCRLGKFCPNKEAERLAMNVIVYGTSHPEFVEPKL